MLKVNKNFKPCPNIHLRVRYILKKAESIQKCCVQYKFPGYTDYEYLSVTRSSFRHHERLRLCWWKAHRVCNFSWYFFYRIKKKNLKLPTVWSSCFQTQIVLRQQVWRSDNSVANLVVINSKMFRSAWDDTSGCGVSHKPCKKQV